MPVKAYKRRGRTVGDASLHIGHVFTYKDTMLAAELRKGSAELLVLGVLQERSRHGYDIARVIEERSGGAITFILRPVSHVLSTQAQELITGKWIKNQVNGGGGSIALPRRAVRRWRTKHRVGALFETLQRVVQVR